uniref:Uncharacterized protein n=1 Tax=viral metagenome TaxID=1070528 RepID=A0A6M3KCC8_9ZZZZ
MIDLTKRFDQRHKWEATGRYSCKCRVCGLAEEIPAFPTLLRVAFDMPVPKVVGTLPPLDDIMQDLPFIKVS